MPTATCPNCQTRVRYPEELLGSFIICPECNNPFSRPEPARERAGGPGRESAPKTLAVQCPACSARIKAPHLAAGRRVSCPKCKRPFTASAPPEGSEPQLDSLELDSLEIVEHLSPAPAGTPTAPWAGAGPRGPNHPNVARGSLVAYLALGCMACGAALGIGMHLGRQGDAPPTHQAEARAEPGAEPRAEGERPRREAERPKREQALQKQVGEPARSSIRYTVVSRWPIPNGGQGKAIVVDREHVTGKGLAALAKQLEKETRGDRSAFVFVFDERKAAEMRARLSQLTPSEEDYYGRHFVGMYTKNGNTGFHQMAIHPQGIDGPTTTIEF